MKISKNVEGRYKPIEERQSLTRIKQHGEKGFAVMSAFRGDDLKKNKEQHKKLMKDLKSAKLRYFVVDGQYKYDDGTIESELSVFVPWNEKEYPKFEDFQKVMSKLGKKYNQESVLIKKPDNGDAVLVYPETGKETVIGKKVGLDKTMDIFTKLKKGSHKARSFIIESVDEPYNHINAMSFKERGQLF